MTRKQFEADRKIFTQMLQGGAARKKAFQAFAQASQTPILQRVKKQVSIDAIFTEHFVPRGSRAEFHAALTYDPDATNEYSGGAADIEVPEISAYVTSESQVHMLMSDQKFVPRQRYECEVGFDLEQAADGIFDWRNDVNNALNQGIVKKMESSGWALIKNIAGNASFPSGQEVTITAGNPGAGAFSPQLWAEMKEKLRTTGVIRNHEQYMLMTFMSTTSLKEYELWNINTEGVDTSSQGQISEKMKEMVESINPSQYDVVLPGGAPAMGLTTLATGDVDSGYDHVYLLLVTPDPVGFVQCVFPAPNGDLVWMQDDPQAEYDDGSFRTKVRINRSFACLDARYLITGRIAR